MADRQDSEGETQHGRNTRVDRHRIASAPGAPDPPRADRDGVDPSAAPAATPFMPERRTGDPAPDAAPAGAKDHTPNAVRRPALLSDRCLSCGASTTGRAGMVTELVEVGPIRALRVVACSACPDRRRRALAGA
jgi:hypothetical protein